ncbi:MAG TPA: hypothetical protein VIY53_04670 [Acidobacteriaceae bacterium]
MWQIFYSIKAALRFRDYNPQPISIRSAHEWMGQFHKGDRRLAGKLLSNVLYFSEKETRQILLMLNAKLMARLANAGVPAKKTVYVSFDETASSSHMMLGMLRDHGALLQRGCNLRDSRDIRGLQEVTNKLEDGAIIYIDDFIGSGRQFGKARDFAMQFVFGNFAEFMLVPSICEEGKAEIEARGVEVVARNVHLKSDRALQATSTFLNPEDRERATAICRSINPRMALGVEDMATMVVFYRNAPNQIPALLRGNKNLTPFKGLFPRTTDLPFEKFIQQPKRMRE